MRTFFVLLLLTAGTFYRAGAQSITGGITAKAGISQIIRASTFGQTTGYDYTNKFRFSYQAGVFGAFNFSPKSGIGIELLYLRQNGLQETILFEFVDTLSGALVSGTDQFYMYVSYFSIPLYYSFTASNVSLHLGAQGNLVLSQTGKNIFNGLTNGDTTNTENTFDSLNFKNYDVGLNAGIRYQVRERVFFGFDYYLGFVNLSNDEAIFSAQNQNFSFAVGYKIFSGSTKSEKEQWYTK